MKDIKVVVATHKKYLMPDDVMYLPLQVGSKGKDKLGFATDDVGDNISEKNPYFCELTGLYWAWKNLDSEYIGLCHYRRYFTLLKCHKKEISARINSVAKLDDINKILEKTDIILPKKRNYYIENLYSHYKHTMYIEPLDEVGKIIEERYSNYLPEFNKLKKRTSAHMFNMFIMKKNILNDYCNWLFDILFELENRTDITKYDAFHARFFGRVSELLLDVWINTNNLHYEEINVVDIEKVNWLKKGTAFLLAKFTNKKYEKSF